MSIVTNNGNSSKIYLSNDLKNRVFSACEELVAQGKKPTITRIREIFGNRGSYGSISQGLKDWKLQNTGETETPQPVQTQQSQGQAEIQSDSMLSNIFNDFNLVVSTINNIKTKFEAQIAELRGELEAVIEDNNDLEERLFIAEKNEAEAKNLALTAEESRRNAEAEVKIVREFNARNEAEIKLLNEKIVELSSRLALAEANISKKKTSTDSETSSDEVKKGGRPKEMMSVDTQTELNHDAVLKSGMSDQQLEEAGFKNIDGKWFAVPEQPFERVLFTRKLKFLPTPDTSETAEPEPEAENQDNQLLLIDNINSKNFNNFGG